MISGGLLVGKFVYTDDLALATQDKHREDVDNFLTEDLKALRKSFADWRLIPSIIKEETMCFTLITNKQKTSKGILK